MSGKIIIRNTKTGEKFVLENYVRPGELSDFVRVHWGKVKLEIEPVEELTQEKIKQFIEEKKGLTRLPQSDPSEITQAA